MVCYKLKKKIMDEKKRAPNFSIAEKNLLTNLVFAYIHIIENKKTDTQTWREKDITWEKITNEFNSKSPQDLPRSRESLRKLYDNIKRKIKKEVSEVKIEEKTGGGLQIFSKPDLDDQSKKLLLNTICKKEVYGDEDISNGHPAETLVFDDPSTEIVVEVDNIIEPGSDVAEQNYSTAEIEQPSPQEENIKVFVEGPKTWDNLEGSSHKQPSTETLQHNWTKRRRPAANLTEEYSSLAKVKLEYYQTEKENLIIKRKHEEILFNLERKKLELEIEIKKIQLDKLKENT